MHPMDSWHGRQGIGPHPSLNSGVLPPGNRRDDCGVCEILPTVSGEGARAVQVGCSVHGEARSDLPEGQQSKGSGLSVEVGGRVCDRGGVVDPDDTRRYVRLWFGGEGLAWLGPQPQEVVDALVSALNPARDARVRAAVAEEIARALENAATDARNHAEDAHTEPALAAVLPHEANALMGAAEIAREHAGKGFPSSVGSPTPEVGTPERPEVGDGN